MITDKSGNHVHGLTKEDFHVLENGKEQKVATLEEIVTTITSRDRSRSSLSIPSTLPFSISTLGVEKWSSIWPTISIPATFWRSWS